MKKECNLTVYEPGIEWTASPEKMGKQVTEILTKYKEMGIVIRTISIEVDKITELGIGVNAIDLTKLDSIVANLVEDEQ